MPRTYLRFGMDRTVATELQDRVIAEADVLTRVIRSPRAGALDNEFDLYVTGWSSEWPSGSQTLPQLFHGSSVFEGGGNYSHLESVEVDDRTAEAEKAPGLVESPDAWAKLGRQILTEQIPQVPIPWRCMWMKNADEPLRNH
ncbi:hypothetical protein [Streptomyces sp. NPDC050164]|uniref:hypothetical protein n=1 Tax=Streptomyces sp. NPDC050164 TaxID=3365605 RepID=UPI00379AEE38